jgi:phosphoribosylanthranilate isomerase
MNNPLIKICGIKTPEMAKLAALAGANYIGIVFDPKSKRCVTHDQAKLIAQTARDHNSIPVAVFMDQTAEEMNAICHETLITTVQLHGNISRSQHNLLPKHYTRFFVNAIPNNADVTRDYIVFDNPQPGSGKLLDLTKFNYTGPFKFCLAGGLNPNNIADIITKINPNLIDTSTGVENTLGEKDILLIEQFIQASKIKLGRYGDFGGVYMPELLIQPIKELTKAFEEIKLDEQFHKNLNYILKNYAGRPTALTEIPNFSKAINGPRVFLKREDLLHTGAHKLNNALGQCLLAKRMGKTRIIAETGAGQHGVATAAACAYLKLSCVVYMGAEDIKRQAPNVLRMKLMGAEVIPVNNGSATLKDAVNEALRDWSASFEDTHYCLGSALGPHPYPEMVALFQAVIGKECKQQFNEIFNTAPDLIIACIGGGSNAIGIFSAFLGHKNTTLIGVEAGGHGNQLGEHAARFQNLTRGVLHGCYTYVLQDENGQIAATSSISAGLDYPAVGPQHAQLFDEKRVTYVNVKDSQALHALNLLAKTEGIICALESAHALAYLIEIAPSLPKDKTVVINLSGRGDKDLPHIQEHL